MQIALIVMLAALPAIAGAQPAPAQGKDAIVCTLLDDCVAPEPSPSGDGPGGRPRVSSARGFSFTRPSPSSARVAERPAGKSAVRARSAPGKYDLRVNFVSGSAELSPDSQAEVVAFAAALNDPRLAERRVLIEGHTDSVGNSASNLDLSKRRALAVADLVSANGVGRARFDVQGHGSTRPLPGLSGRASANRRVTASLVK